MQQRISDLDYKSTKVILKYEDKKNRKPHKPKEQSIQELAGAGGVRNISV